jgi:hypothetical protein
MFDLPTQECLRSLEEMNLSVNPNRTRPAVVSNNSASTRFERKTVAQESGQTDTTTLGSVPINSDSLTRKAIVDFVKGATPTMGFVQAERLDDTIHNYRGSQVLNFAASVAGMATNFAGTMLTLAGLSAMSAPVALAGGALLITAGAVNSLMKKS